MPEKGGSHRRGGETFIVFQPYKIDDWLIWRAYFWDGLSQSNLWIWWNISTDDSPVKNESTSPVKPNKVSIDLSELFHRVETSQKKCQETMDG